MPAQHISDADFQKLVLESDKPALVDFYAEWCGPCKMAAPVLDALSEELKGKVTIVKMDVDANGETPQKYGVMSIPTVILFNKGAELDRKVGFGGEKGYRDLIAKATA
ncbi:MAG TPA: thioredoxin [Candidatus Pacebacteria bacterium]|nr:MAG: Thioredoxin [Microgenomates group bacterium GW2011_GWB1_45_17]KKU23093.1 MAG: Thioredoxin [Microgenomates group bacterium GW2011_GWA1_46_15]KKU23756.1 MAG: Thioredoxin [Microgenomates group bacterium GW2011_GWC1_46_15]OGJ21636.1 MAG: thioredoxin [Candidatus Pacebacteria bacterium RIFCSPHIGHO2_01_FULL_46_10]HAV15030.1 thioredoxin [Candidatus Paceibacterota bacterium]